jgi:hypothetical protein
MLFVLFFLVSSDESLGSVIDISRIFCGTAWRSVFLEDGEREYDGVLGVLRREGGGSTMRLGRSPSPLTPRFPVGPVVVRYPDCSIPSLFPWLKSQGSSLLNSPSRE